jgi:hypothetical protein
MTIKDCPVGKILNTLTNRCVKIDGKIGKDIIKNLTLKQKNISKDKKETKEKKDKKETKEKKDKKETKEKKDKKEKKETSIINLLDKFENCKKNIDNKYKSVKDKLNKTYFIINASIIDNLDKNDVILDPAGLTYMKTKFIHAGWASDAIYNLLEEKKPNPDVITHFNQFNNADYLYEKNTHNLSIAYYTSYNNNIKIIHAVGPDFRFSQYLKKIIENDNLTDLYNLFYKVYNDIYKSFIYEYRRNICLKLRLLPISTGSFIEFDKNYKIKIFKCLKNIYQILYKKYTIKPVIYLYDKNDYKLFKNIILN